MVKMPNAAQDVVVREFARSSFGRHVIEQPALFSAQIENRVSPWS
jgi:hypothetical protein